MIVPHRREPQDAEMGAPAERSNANAATTPANASWLFSLTSATDKRSVLSASPRPCIREDLLCGTDTSGHCAGGARARTRRSRQMLLRCHARIGNGALKSTRDLLVLYYNAVVVYISFGSLFFLYEDAVLCTT